MVMALLATADEDADGGDYIRSNSLLHLHLFQLKVLPQCMYIYRMKLCQNTTLIKIVK